MMKEKLKQAIVMKLLPKYGSKFNSDVAWAWAQVRAAGQAANTEGRQEIIRALSDTKVIRSHLRDLAESEADGFLADNSLNLDELERIL